ncbi:CrcB-like protein-domain-containing protein [Aspergillus caelatus]|uniref:CrcB-like protein-domain-containing protein n=1 Tax=Aspergillus caelatus TaxID=61420 RepID=A0A5N7AME6_9EURO|nr:CrcB-like protein-domain-containing protein [Aspergillus caelatus]KAE8370873.1 CrcB-like protein-domain-containing protein [Aspergillus caelatus]
MEKPIPPLPYDSHANQSNYPGTQSTRASLVGLSTGKAIPDEVTASSPVHSNSKSSQQSGSDEPPRSNMMNDEKRNNPSFSKTLTAIHVYSYLVIFSFIGTLVRLVIESLAFYPGAPVNTSVLWTNVGGSCLMGFLSEDRELFRAADPEISDELWNTQHATRKKTIPLYIGLTTGLCGCLTSFSTFARDLFLALANDLPVPLGPYQDVSLFQPTAADTKAPNGGFSFMAIIAILITEIGLSLAGLSLGAHIAIFTAPWTPTVPFSRLRRVLNPLVMLFAGSCWVALIILVALLPHSHDDISLWAPEIWQGPFLFALVFSPIGCLLRFFLSMKLNGRIPHFPLGTFVVNVGGTMLFGMAFSLQHATISSSNLGGGSYIGCQILQGIMDGFCGCFTTVSTWVLELSALKRGHAYLYGGLTVIVALGALTIEIGSLQWTQGLTTPICFA